MPVSTHPTPLRLGFDIGSVALKLVVTDVRMHVLDRVYRRTHGSPLTTAWEVFREVAARWHQASWEVIAGSGSAAVVVCESLAAPQLNEVLAQAAAIRHLCPQARTLIEIGGQDSKILTLADPGDEGRLLVDFAMNSQCAAGTGSFLDQQAARLGIRIEEEFARLALQSATPPSIAGRCSVFAKSDMIHLQQRATPVADILAGLCLGLARNLRSNLAQGRAALRPLAFCGGVASNAGVVRALEQAFELAPGELIVPAEHAYSGALGAILLALQERLRGDQGYARPAQGRLAIEGLAERLDHPASRSAGWAPLRPPGNEQLPATPASQPSPPADQQPLDAYLGLDVGSISTKIAVIDDQQRLLAKVYLMTAGRPLDAVRDALRSIHQQLGDRVRIRGAATTGSGRYLTGDFIGADLVVNEITAQATAATAIDPQVDTIFEIGGQDSKYVSLDQGTVVDFEMNHACAAGTGSFLEEQAERLGVPIDRQFADLALQSRHPLRLGDRCTVFMESDLVSFQQQGAAREDLIAGLCYSIVHNYLNRVVGHRRVGRRIFFQGGTAFNQAVLAAFQQVTGCEVRVPPHHEVTGAIGAAILVQRQQMAATIPSRFGGFALADAEYQTRRFACQACDNACEVSEVRLAGRDPLYYGARCDRWERHAPAAVQTPIPDLFAQRNAMLLHHAGLDQPPAHASGDGPCIGIPRALANHELLPLWATLLRCLGFRVLVSPATTRAVIRAGVGASIAHSCFPVKIAYGHALWLIEHGAQWLWTPGVASLGRESDDPVENQCCPYVAGLPYALKAALEQAGQDTRLLAPLVRLHEGPAALLASLDDFARQFGFSRRQMAQAVNQAWRAQGEFADACRQRGQQLMRQLPPARRHVVLVGRSYSACDPEAYLHLADKLRGLGVLPIPLDLLDPPASAPDDDLFQRMYWKNGQRFLRAAERIRDDPRLHAIYLSSFSCGPDSFIIDYFRRRMRSRETTSAAREPTARPAARADKPALVLEIDEHSADAGLMTRLEAFLESLAAAAPPAAPPRALPLLPDGRSSPDKSNAKSNGQPRTLYVPWMSDIAYGLAAAFRAYGQDAQVIPPGDGESVAAGRRWTSGKECLPCIITAGDMIRTTQRPGFDPRHSAFLMPSGSGPCRFGQYHCLHQLILEDLGLPEVPVIAPAHDKRLYEDWEAFPGRVVSMAWNGLASFDVLAKVRLAIRPYECAAGTTDRVYHKWCRRLRRLIALRPSQRQIVALMARAARDFAAIAVDRSRPRPRIAVLGEIYVRHHSLANQHLLRHLERLGAEAQLASYPEWHYYTNWVRMNDARRTGRLKDWWTSYFKDRIQRRRHASFAAPFQALLGPLEEPSTESLLQPAAAYIHPELKGGDAVLSIGKTLEAFHAGQHGVINVLPFSCMPSSIVEAVMKRMATAVAPMPLLSISYDGNHDPALHTRLEAFVYQARAYQTSASAVSRRP